MWLKCGSEETAVLSHVSHTVCSILKQRNCAVWTAVRQRAECQRLERYLEKSNFLVDVPITLSLKDTKRTRSYMLALDETLTMVFGVLA